MNLEEITIAQLQQKMTDGELTARDIVSYYLNRIETIDQLGPKLNSVIELNPDALAIADGLDAERVQSGARGLLHGIPILLKDNIDTADQMETTAGSLALLTSRPGQDATVVKQLREAGAIILGKTNLSEWANFRSTQSTSGWSGRGGQTRNPYVITRNPCGSSSGSGVAISANLGMVALGTETDGSIVCPSSVNGIVGIKPTVGLTSRAGVVPISHTQDTVGPMARTVADAAVVLGTLVGVDERDSATPASAGKFHTDYAQFLNADGLRGARIGVSRAGFTGYDEAVDALLEQAIDTMREAGAVIVDPADLPSMEQLKEDRESEFEVLLYEFKANLAAYLLTRQPKGDEEIPRTLADLIAFNSANADAEMPHFGQEIFEMAQAKGDLTDEDYLNALERSQRLAGAEGIDAVMAEYQLDALIAPTGGPSWLINYESGDNYHGSSSAPAARTGYPLVTLPMGFIGELPVGLTFMGGAFSEGVLIRLAYGYEQASLMREKPKLLEK